VIADRIDTACSPEDTPEHQSQGAAGGAGHTHRKGPDPAAKRISDRFLPRGRAQRTARPLKRESPHRIEKESRGLAIPTHPSPLRTIPPDHRLGRSFPRLFEVCRGRKVSRLVAGFRPISWEGSRGFAPSTQHLPRGGPGNGHCAGGLTPPPGIEAAGSRSTLTASLTCPWPVAAGCWGAASRARCEQVESRFSSTRSHVAELGLDSPRKPTIASH